VLHSHINQIKSNIFYTFSLLSRLIFKHERGVWDVWGRTEMFREFWWEKMKERNRLEDTFKWITLKLCWKIQWNGWNWINWVLLSMVLALMVLLITSTSWIDEALLASQEGKCSMELLNWLFFKINFVTSNYYTTFIAQSYLWLYNMELI
jgi:hypothetical protein